MTEQEEKDLAEMQKKCDKIRETAFWAMRDYLRMTPEELQNTGYATSEAAVVSYFKHAQAQIDKLVTAHLKKYPD